MTAAPPRIDSRTNPKVQRWRKLAGTPTAYRDAAQVWIEGEHLCNAFAEQGGRALQAVVSDRGWESRTVRATAATAASVTQVADSVMASICSLPSAPPLAFVIALPRQPGIDAGAPTLVLDRLQDPGNAGTLLRSAAAFGFSQVIALTGTAALWSPKVLRAGMGAHFSLRLVEGVGESQLDALAVPLLATSSHARALLHEGELPWPCGWVLGHEGDGIAATLLQRCERTLRIAQPGGGESLNVAAAGAICLHESARQRLLRQR